MARSALCTQLQNTHKKSIFVLKFIRIHFSLLNFPCTMTCTSFFAKLAFDLLDAPVLVFPHSPPYQWDQFPLASNIGLLLLVWRSHSWWGLGPKSYEKAPWGQKEKETYLLKSVAKSILYSKPQDAKPIKIQLFDERSISLYMHNRDKIFASISIGGKKKLVLES